MLWPLGEPLYLSASVENCGLQEAICNSLETVYEARVTYALESHGQRHS